MSNVAGSDDETSSVAGSDYESSSDDASEDKVDATFSKYLVGLQKDGFSIKDACREFEMCNTATRRYSYTRALMCRRSVLPSRLSRERPGRPGGRGNGAMAKRFMAARNYEEAFHVYTCQLVDSKPRTKERARALDGRSRALYRMGRYAQCVDDVERALAEPWGPPDGLRLDLFCRGGNAARRLGRNAHTVDAYFKRACLVVYDMEEGGSLSPERARDIRDRLNRAPLLPPSFGPATAPWAPRPPREEDDVHRLQLTGAPHQLFPAFSEHLQFKPTPDMGVGVFTTQELQPGDILAIEEPYIGMPLEDNFYICQYADCQKFNMAVIFCQKCTLVYYCSEKCLKNDKLDGVHKLECPVIRAVSRLPGNKKINQLALKWFLLESTKMGIDEYCSVVKVLSKSELDPFQKKNIKYGKYNNFVSAYSMKIQDSPSMKTLLFFNCVVVEMLQFLSYSGYHIVDYQLPTIGSSIVKMIQILYTYSLNFLPLLNHGFSLYPTMSQLNHSCDPNIMVRQLPDKRTLVLRALRPIPKDNQLLISYGTTFFNDAKKDRRKHLKEFFHFKCCCQPCKEDWGTREHLSYFFSPKQIINPEALGLTLFKCWEYESTRKNLVGKEDDEERISENKQFFFSFIKFMHTNLKRPVLLLEDCHDVILKYNDSYSIDPECYKLWQLMCIVNSMFENKKL